MQTLLFERLLPARVIMPGTLFLVLATGGVAMAADTDAGPARAGEPVSPPIQVVRLGFSGPLTGPNAIIGNDALNGMQIAVDRLNQQGFSLHGRALRFETLVRDDHSDPQRGAAIARELIDGGISALLGPINSGVAMAVARLYNDARIPMLTAGSHPRVTQPGLPYVFRIVSSDADMGAKMAQYASRNLKLRAAAVIEDGSAYAQGLADAFQRGSRAAGIHITQRETLSGQSSDAMIVDALRRIRHGGAQAVFVGAYSLQSGRVIRQMRQLGMDIPVLGGDALCSAAAVQAAGEALADNTYCVLGGGWLTKVADGAVFAAGYQNKFGRAPDVYAASFYDGVMLLAQAVKSSGSVEGRHLMPALARARYKGISAGYEFGPGRDLKDATVTILRFKSGELVPLASF